MLFRAPSDRTGAQLELAPEGAVVLVGPNNAGKSLALREIETWSAGQDAERHVISAIEAAFPDSVEQVLELIQPFIVEPPQGLATQEGVVWAASGPLGAGNNAGAYQIAKESLVHAVAGRTDPGWDRQLREQILRPLTMRLDGHTRFELSGDAPCGDLQRRGENHLAMLFRDDARRLHVRELTARAFTGPRFFVLEFVGDGTLRIRMSARTPEDAEEEQGIGSRSRAFHAAAPLLTQQGDGMRAFTGLVSAIVSLPHRLVLIDEPEAFLHPTLARRLGNDLSTIAAERETTLVAATHSAAFLMGCIDAGIGVTVVRLTYDAAADAATARQLSARDLNELITDPLLRSTGALDALFHRAVVVCEADADRAFYDEINRRLVATGSRGVGDALFSNAQNWQTIERIIGPLRRLGIPAAAVMDLDTLTVDGEWGRIFAAAHVTGQALTKLHEARAQAGRHIRSLGSKKPHKKKGVAALPPAKRKQVQATIAALRRYGIFIVPVGELERWLPDLGVTGRKAMWIVRMFRALGGDPEHPAHISPSSKDVWEFVDAIREWVDDPNRLGLP